MAYAWSAADMFPRTVARHSPSHVCAVGSCNGRAHRVVFGQPLRLWLVASYLIELVVALESVHGLETQIVQNSPILLHFLERPECKQFAL